MKNGFIAVVLAALVGCGSSLSPSASVQPVSQAQSPDSSSYTQLVNNFRTNQGAGTVRQSAVLTRAAQAHAEDMERRGYFSHSSVGGPNGNTLMARATSAGCNMRAGAENIAQGQRSEQDVFVAWQNSPGHRANLLGRAYTEYGLGRAGNTWVMKFSSGC